MSTSTTGRAGVPDPGEHVPGGRVLPLRPRAGGPDSVPGSAAVGNSGDAVGGDRSLVGPVIEGELLTEEESAAVAARLAGPAGGPVRWAGPVRRVASTGVGAGVVLARRVRTVATHDTTQVVARSVLRNALYVPAGLGVVAKRVWEARTTARYERLMRGAEAAGDFEAVALWEERAERFKAARHERAMDWLRAPAQVARAGLTATLALLITLAGIGVVLAFAQEDPAAFLDPFTAVLSFVRWVILVVTVVWGPLVLAAPWVALAYLWDQGRRKATLPGWVVAPRADGDQLDRLPDESTIVKALQNLGIPGFTRAVKEGWQVKFIEPPHLDGKGWRAQLALPLACPVVEIVKRKTMLAHNLARFPNEVWPTEPIPSVLDLWVAKSGALSGPVDPWPVLDGLERAECDYFTGVPVAVTIRGDMVRGRLSEANYAFGGIMGSGKSTMAITLVLGAMLDPLVDIDVVVLAENADYEPMKPRLRSLTTGAGQDTVDACMTLLTSLYDDLSVRGQALREHDHRAVNRRLAAKDTRLRPRVVVIDECQALFMGQGGRDAIEIAAKLLSAARKYAITLVFLTPEPSKDALPRKLMSIISNKACFAIGDQTANDAVLGTGSYKAGISAVGLTPKTDDDPGDVGTCMARGFTAQPCLLRSFYVPQTDAHRVTHRALELRAGIAPAAPAEPAAAQVDPLADIAAVLTTSGQDRMRTQEVLAALATRNPGHYRSWTFTDLANALPDSAKPYKTGGVMQLSIHRIHEAITERDHQADEDDTDD